MNNVAAVWTIPDENQMRIWLATIPTFINSNLKQVKNKKIKLNIISQLGSQKILEWTKSIREDLEFELNIYCPNQEHELFKEHGQFWWVLCLKEISKDYKKAIFIDQDIYFNSNFLENPIWKKMSKTDFFAGRGLSPFWSPNAAEYMMKKEKFSEAEVRVMKTINCGVVFSNLKKVRKLDDNRFYKSIESHLESTKEMKLNAWFSDELMILNLFRKNINPNLEVDYNITSNYPIEKLNEYFESNLPYNFHATFINKIKSISSFGNLITCKNEEFNEKIDEIIKNITSRDNNCIGLSSAQKKKEEIKFKSNFKNLFIELRENHNKYKISI